MTAASKSLSTWSPTLQLSLAAIMTFVVNILSLGALIIDFAIIVPNWGCTFAYCANQNSIYLSVLVAPLVLEGLLCLLLLLSKKRRSIAAGIALGAVVFVVFICSCAVLGYLAMSATA